MSELAVPSIVKKVSRAAIDQKFVHREWYLKLHLEVVEKITKEICGEYNQPYDYLTRSVVWMHDYGKIVGRDREYDYYSKFLCENGFSQRDTDTIVEDIYKIDLKEDISTSTFRVQAVSSADGVSHLITPFYMLYWRENSTMRIENILEENHRKIAIDWEQKITLADVKAKYESFYRCLLVQLG